MDVNGLGDGIKGVGISMDVEKVSGDDVYDGKLCDATVADFGFTEEGDEGLGIHW